MNLKPLIRIIHKIKKLGQGSISAVFLYPPFCFDGFDGNGSLDISYFVFFACVHAWPWLVVVDAVGGDSENFLDAFM